MARPKLLLWIKREKLDLTVIETNSVPCSTPFKRLQKPAQILRAYGKPITRAHSLKLAVLALRKHAHDFAVHQ